MPKVAQPGSDLVRIQTPGVLSPSSHAFLSVPVRRLVCDHVCEEVHSRPTHPTILAAFGLTNKVTIHAERHILGWRSNLLKVGVLTHLVAFLTVFDLPIRVKILLEALMV